MGDITGFLKHGRELPARRPVPVRLRDWKEVYEPFPVESGPAAGGPLHGLRDPVLPRGLPPGQPDPGVERSRLPGRLVGGHRAAARHQQLPRVHRPTVPGSVRRLLRAGHQRRPGDHRADRVRDHRAGLVRGMGRCGAPVGAERQAGGGGGLGSGRPGRGPAADPGRARRGGVRTGREARRPAPLRDPRVQDGEGGAGPAPRPAGGRGRRVPLPGVGRGARHPRSTGPRRRMSPWSAPDRWWRSSTACCWPAAPRCPATCRSPAGSWPGSTGPWTSSSPPTWSRKACSTSPPSRPRASTW